MAPQPPSRLPRKDAQRNRESILHAARELFSHDGDVPLSEVARRAGVGQATLYRHFSDRDELAAVLFGEQMDGLEELAARHEEEPDALFVVLRGLVDSLLRFHGLVDCITAGPRNAAMKAVLTRYNALIQRVVAGAKKAKLIRHDVTVEDVALLVAAIAGCIERQRDAASRASAAHRMLMLVVEGLAAAGQ
jgi:AcrR family transcriptional regulator